MIERIRAFNPEVAAKVERILALAATSPEDWYAALTLAFPEGEVWNTGGHVMVWFLPCGQQTAIGVDHESVCVYHNADAACIEDVVFSVEKFGVFI